MWQRVMHTVENGDGLWNIALILLVIAASSVAPKASADAQPHRSLQVLSLANGYAAATYLTANEGEITHCINGFYEHIYQAVNPGVPSVNLCYDVYFGLRAAGAQEWGKHIGELTVEYLDGGVLHTVQMFNGLRLDTYYFTPFDSIPDQSSEPGNMLTVLCRISNPGSTTISDNALFGLYNFRTGAGRPNPGNNQETIQWHSASNAFIERSTDSNHVLAYVAVTAPERHATSTDNPAEDPYWIVKNGNTLPNRDYIAVGPNRVCAFQWSVPALGPGEFAWGGTVIGYCATNANDVLAAVSGYINGRGAAALLADERAEWRSWLAGLTRPEGLSADEAAVFEQQAAMMRMAQCREPNSGDFRPHGQIPASLPPGQWNITWVRDGAYAIQALIKIGAFDLARAALAFYLSGQTGAYRNFVYNNVDYGLGVDYAPSVCRYYGSGLEESDGGDDPNIELDDFGLLLGTVAEYVLASGDADFYHEHTDALLRRTAYVVAAAVSANGLLRADSSCWERHLSQALQYGFSDIVCVWGVNRLAAAAEAVGDSATAGRLAGQAGALHRAIMTNLINGRMELIGAAGYPDYLDGAMAEAIGMGLVHPGGTVAGATLDAFRDRLWIAATNHGYQRLTGRPLVPADWYDEQEWVFIDMRIAEALRQAGRTDEAEALIAWVTAQALENFNVIPELFDEVSANYEGAYPMMGFGAGAYILALFGRQPGQLAELRGQITIAGSGQPAGGADVLCLRDGQPLAAGTAEPQGYYRLAGLNPGTVTVLARHGTGAEVSAPVQLAPGAIVTLDLTVNPADPPGHSAAPPGAPGAPSRWTPGRKRGFASSRGPSAVWFTVGDGRLAETAFPRVDLPAFKEIRFLVTDGATFFADSTVDCAHDIEWLSPDAPAYRVTETDRAGRFRIMWEPVTATALNALFLRISLDVLQGAPDNVRVYLWLDPHLRLAGADDSVDYVEAERQPLLVFSDRDAHAAFGSAGDWDTFSCGYKGSASDPLADLRAGPPYHLDGLYYRAGAGHVGALVGFAAPVSVPLEVFLAFGQTHGEAISSAIQARTEITERGFAALQQEFIAGWTNYAAGLLDLSPWAGDGGAAFRAAWQTLAAAEDKTFAGAAVAAPSFAWGQDEDEGRRTYQKIWGRDLYHTGLGLLAAGDNAGARRCLEHMAEIHRDADGSMPQHAYVDGARDPWQNEQLDETAAPLLLAWHLWRTAGALQDGEIVAMYPGFLKPAADFLAAAQPQSSQDRWEEEFGWSPATLADMTAGLICAADCASAAGDSSSRSRYLNRADQLEAEIDNRTFTVTGGLGDGRYYVRIDQTGDPDDNATIEINSGGGVHREKDIVSLDFLELVRVGIRRPTDPRVLDSLPESEAGTAVELVNGIGFHRYNHDGYGEKADGRTYLAAPAFTGIGRVWPLLTGERAQQVLAAGGDAAMYFAAYEAQALSGGLFPEQVWDQADLPSMGLSEGQASNAAGPLSWAAAEYLALLRTARDGRIFGRVGLAYARYANLPPEITAAAAAPDWVDNSGMAQTLFTVDAADQDGWIASAVVDLGPLGFSQVALADDGSGGDVAPGDGRWSVLWTAPAGTTPGAYQLPCQVADDVGATVAAVIPLTVIEAGDPTPTLTPTPTPTLTPTAIDSPSPTPTSGGSPTSTPTPTPTPAAGNQPPVIWAAGLANTRLSANSRATLALWAVVIDPDGQNDIANVEVLLDGGATTGWRLADDGAHGDGAAGDMLFGFEIDVPSGLSVIDRFRLFIRASDRAGAVGHWPAVTVPERN